MTAMAYLNEAVEWRQPPFLQMRAAFGEMGAGAK